MDADGWLTREDFDSREDWLRYRFNGGLDITEGDDRFSGISGSGYYATLLGAVLGHTRREYERAWLGRGQTDSVSVLQFQKAYRAVAFANCMGLMMNTAVDIAWSTAGVEGDLAVTARQRDLLDALRRWCDRNGLPAAWIWVLEQGPKLGLHSHILMHVPDEHVDKFRQYATVTLSRLVVKRLANTKASKTLLIAHRWGNQITPQWLRFKYMMKGLTADSQLPARDEFENAIKFSERVAVRPKPQGQVRVKRLGVSRALDHAACKSWAALNDFPSTQIRRDFEELYDDRYLRWFWDNQHQLRKPSVTDNGGYEPA